MGKHAKKIKRSKYARAAGLTAGGMALPFVWPTTAVATVPYSAGAVTQFAQEGCPELDAEELDTAVRIAYAESGFNADAWNQSGEDSRGFWQINTDAHGSPWGDLFDPLTNAIAMCDISSGGSDWSPWTTYVSGAYLSSPGADLSGGTPPRDPDPVAPAPDLTPYPEAPVEQKPIPVDGRHTVEWGDTLYDISRQYLGDGHRWGQVYRENRETVGDNPHLIFPGQDLDVDIREGKYDSGKPKSDKAKPTDEPAPSPEPSHSSFVHPVGGAAVGQPYGNANAMYALGYHTGVDFSAASGTNTVAVTSGEVVASDTSSAYGVNVQIKHDDGYYSLYAHLSGAAVSPGDRVEPGDLVGYVGSTGNSSGPHLHYEIRTTPQFGDGNFIDPLEYLRNNGLVI
jgi:murein DD-endopeptidase MepM/ murein hydrolase activator NlpD